MICSEMQKKTNVIVHIIVCSDRQSAMTRQVHENLQHPWEQPVYTMTFIVHSLCSDFLSEATYSPVLWFRSLVSCPPPFVVLFLGHWYFWDDLLLKSSKVLGSSVFHPLQYSVQRVKSFCCWVWSRCPHCYSIWDDARLYFSEPVRIFKTVKVTKLN